MDCREATELLAGRALGDLAPADRDDLEAHLALCDDCHVLAEESAEVLESLRRFADEERRDAVPPADVDHAVRVGRALLARDAPAGPIARPASTMTRVLRAAVIVLAVVGASALFDARVAVGNGTLDVSLALPGTRTGDRSAAPPETTPPKAAPLPGERSVEAFPGYAGDAGARPLAPRMEHAVQRAVEQAVRPMLSDVARWLMASEDRRAELAAYLEERRLQDAQAVAELLTLTQKDIEVTRDSQEALWSVVRDIPAARTPR